MLSCPRLFVRFAATVGVATVLSIATAVAAETAGEVCESSVARAATSMVAPRVARSTQIANLTPRRAKPHCTAWCGRHFVLMVGIAY
jgi:hypothetical protein